MPRRRREKQPRETFNQTLESFKKERVTPRTPRQAEYIQAVKQNDMILCVGPPGTGKTRISIGLAIEALDTGKIDRVVITRPMVGAGEEPGALPGGLEQKIAPFLRPIFEEMKYFASKSQIAKWKKEKVIDVCPLAYTRGITFKNSYIILDEAQNATYEQLKMLITRLGEGSKILVNGDISQTDLAKKYSGGLSTIVEIMDGVKGVSIIKFDKSDIVRHHLIKELMERFEDYEQKQKQQKGT